MKKIVVVFLLIIFQTELSAQFYSFDFAKKYGDNGDDEVWASVTDKNGYTYIAGSTNGGIFGPNLLTVPSGFTDMLVAKFDSLGNCIWATNGGGMGNDWGFAIALDDSGNVVVAGEISSGAANFGSYSVTSAGQGDIVVVKLNSLGYFQWAKRAGGTTDDIGEGIDVDAAGNIYVTGRHCTGATFGSLTIPTQGAFLAKYSSGGNCLWVRNSNTGSSDAAYAVKTDDAGNSYITGQYQGTATFGSFSLTNSGAWDYFVAKYNSSGTCLWAKKAGGTATECGNAITLDENGNCYVAGYFYQTVNFTCATYTNTSTGYETFIAKYDINGNCQWINRSVGGNGNWPLGIARDAWGYVYVTGWFQQAITFDGIYSATTGASNKDVFVVKLNPLGDCTGLFKIGGTQPDYCNGIGIDTSNNLYLAGYFTGTVDFNPGPATNNLTAMASPNNDVFITSLSLCMPDETSIDTTGCTGSSYTFPDGSSTSVAATNTSYFIKNNGCDSIIYTNFSIVPNLTLTNLGDSIVATAIADNYQWLYCDSAFAPIVGANDSLFVPANGGNYAVEITTNGCVDTSSCATLFVLSLSENIPDHSILFYPVPADEFVFISGAEQPTDFLFRTIDGKIILKGCILPGQESKIDVNNLPSGMYLVEMRFRGLITHRKFLITHR